MFEQKFIRIDLFRMDEFEWISRVFIRYIHVQIFNCL